MSHTPWFLSNQPLQNHGGKLAQSQSVLPDRVSLAPTSLFNLKSAPNPATVVSSSEEEVFVNSKLIKFEHLSKYFECPITEVAKKFGVCTTVLKKVCRKNGIPRWPFRKLKSLDKKILALESCIQSNPDEGPHLQAEIAILRNRKKRIVENPACLALNKNPNANSSFDHSNVSGSKSDDDNDSNDIIDGSNLLLNLTPVARDHKKQNLSFLTSKPKPAAFDEEPNQYRPSLHQNPIPAPSPNSMYAASPSPMYSPAPSPMYSTPPNPMFPSSSVSLQQQFSYTYALPRQTEPQQSFYQAQEILEKLSVETIERNLFDSANASAMLPFYGKSKIALSPPTNLPTQLFTPRSFFTKEEMTPPHLNWSNSNLRSFSSCPDSSELSASSPTEDIPKVSYFSPQTEVSSLPQLGKRSREEAEDMGQSKRARIDSKEATEEFTLSGERISTSNDSANRTASEVEEKESSADTVHPPRIFPPFPSRS